MLPSAAPSAVDDVFVLLVDAEASILDVLANDSDPDNNLDATSLAIVTGPEVGTAVLVTANDSPMTSYTPSTAGEVSMVYEVCDTTGLCDQATVLLTVLPVSECTITGTSGPDTLVGTDGDDIICGRGGADVIEGGDGDDIIFGGRGADTIDAGDGDDLVFGGRGHDDIRGGKGADDLRGGRGADVIRGNRGPDRIRGGRGADDLRGGRGADDIGGNRGDDVLSGGRGRDLLKGGRGFDEGDGGAGVDECRNLEIETRCET